MALVSYDQVSIHELRKSSLAYWTIVGAYIAKGETTEYQTFVDTAVFDIRTKKMLFRAPGAHSDPRNQTAVGYEKANREMSMNSFKMASAAMTDNLALELARFKERVKQGKDIRVEYDKKTLLGRRKFRLGALIGLLMLLRFTRIKK